MALRFIEGAELYGGSSSVPSEMRAKWTVDDYHSCKPNQTGRLFGNSIGLGANGSQDNITTPQFGSTNTWIVGFGMKRFNESDLFSSGISEYYATGPFLYVMNGSSVACQIDRQPTSFVLRNASFSTLFTWNVPDNATYWEYLEFKFVVNGASSSCEMRLDGVSQGSSGTKTFSQSTANKFKWNTTYGGTDGLGYLLDDVYICDGTGSSRNDFLGECGVEGIVPSGAGSATEGTPSVGSNYACIDERPSNSDSDYVTLTGAGQKDLYAFGNLANVNGTIHGVQLNAVAKQVSGTENVGFVHRHSSTNYTTTPTDGDANGSYKTIWAVAPTSDGSTSWTASSVNAAEFGVQLS